METFVKIFTFQALILILRCHVTWSSLFGNASIAFECGKQAKYFNQTSDSWEFYEAIVIKFCQDIDEIIKLLCIDIFGMVEQDITVEQFGFSAQIFMCSEFPNGCSYNLLSPYSCREIPSTTTTATTTTTTTTPAPLIANKIHSYGKPEALKVNLEHLNKYGKKIENADSTIEKIVDRLKYHVNEKMANDDEDVHYYRRLLIILTAIVGTGIGILLVTQILERMRRRNERRLPFRYKPYPTTTGSCGSDARLKNEQESYKIIDHAIDPITDNDQNQQSEIQIDSIYANEKYVDDNDYNRHA